MGKKGSWFSAIKRAFTHNSKEKPSYEKRNRGSDKKSSKDKGSTRHGETKSLIPRFREPSSIEKILGEADEFLSRPPAYSEVTKTPPGSLWRPASLSASPKAPSPKAVLPKAVVATTVSPDAASFGNARPKATQNRRVQRPELTLRNQHRSATLIQAAFRGYLARRNFRALRGLVRLQVMVRSHNAKRQTTNAMKQMQLLVRVQTQIQSRRIQMLELQRQSYIKEVEGNLSKRASNQPPEASNDEHWDDSLLTKEEEEARLRKKVEAVAKRERAMAYAYSHQLWKTSPKTEQTPVDIRSNGFPWWWNWLERQLPPPKQSRPKDTVLSTPPRPVTEYGPSPQLKTTTNSTRAKQGSNNSSKPRGIIKPSYDYPLKDDDSLASCPAPSVPSYMAPTVSAKAKARANSNPKERLIGGAATPVNESKRRFSFSFTTNIGSFKGSKGSNRDSVTQKGLEKHVSSRFIGDLSIDSTVSMPAVVGRKPFNRFV